MQSDSQSKAVFLVLATLVFALSSADVASAHQPEYVASQTAIAIPNAETSMAYYGELSGLPVTYTMTSATPFPLYVNILSPLIPGASKDFSVTINDGAGAVVSVLDGQHFTWKQWYEEFAGDMYWKGPEYKSSVAAGTYTFTVSNPTNTGKYVLAPGEAEVFTAGGTPHTIREIYAVKTKFFGKQWYSIFEGIIGKTLLGLLILLLIGIILIFYLRRRYRRTTVL